MDKTQLTGTQILQSERNVLDVRRRHADAISHALFDEIRHLLPREIEREVSRTLREAVYRNGTMLINDREAERLGLEPKDRHGWTSSERVQMKLDKHAAMLQMMNIQINSVEQSDG